MKLIIDINEQEYKDICENGYIYDEDNEEIAKIIKDGTPLEEELEKLKDKMMDDGAYFQEVEGYTDFVKGISHCIDIVEKELLRLEGEHKE